MLPFANVLDFLAHEFAGLRCRPSKLAPISVVSQFKCGGWA
jgi:hypothetical protein